MPKPAVKLSPKATSFGRESSGGGAGNDGVAIGCGSGLVVIAVVLSAATAAATDQKDETCEGHISNIKTHEQRTRFSLPLILLLISKPDDHSERSYQNGPLGTEDLTILDEVSFEIPDGQFVAVTGASGSGKSTLLGLIAGLDAPSSGSIRIDDDEITAMSEDATRSGTEREDRLCLPVVSPDPEPHRLREYPDPDGDPRTDRVRDRADRLLEAVDLANRGHHYPSELSGGEQQRVAIARAFANRPKILLADEPTGNLDTKNGKHIFDLMAQLHRQNNVTLILVTHDEKLARQAQRQIILADGKVIADDEISR